MRHLMRSIGIPTFAIATSLSRAQERDDVPPIVIALGRNPLAIGWRRSRR